MTATRKTNAVTRWPARRQRAAAWSKTKGWRDDLRPLFMPQKENRPDKCWKKQKSIDLSAIRERFTKNTKYKQEWEDTVFCWKSSTKYRKNTPKSYKYITERLQTGVFANDDSLVLYIFRCNSGDNNNSYGLHMEKVLVFLRKMRYYCNDFIENERCHYALTLWSGISGGVWCLLYCVNVFRKAAKCLEWQE